MGEGFQYFDILLFAMVAAFLVLQLRRVLGRRTGTERPRDPLAGRLGVKRDASPVDPADNVVALPDRAKAAEEPGAPSTPQTVASGLDEIRNADPQFNVDVFLGGARAAFELIVHAFANGDTASLRPLLSDEVYEQFTDAINHRVAEHETHETNLVSIKSADVEEAELNGRTAFVTVKFVSDQINVTRAADGHVVDGDADRVVEKTDFWTFARNTRSQDPNWLLVATRSV
jgi:predicted lipid-binding transport protein (Tim44 family)